jgi:hypothetical protein
MDQASAEKMPQPTNEVLMPTFPLTHTSAHLTQFELFCSGQEGYHTFRVPALAVTAQ